MAAALRPWPPRGPPYKTLTDRIRVAFGVLRLADAALLGGESIAAVKRWLARDCKVPAARIEVLLGARRLEDDAQLWDYDVESGEMLRLSFRNATGDLDDLDDLDGSDLEGDDIDGSNSKVAAEALAQDFPAVLI